MNEWEVDYNLCKWRWEKEVPEETLRDIFEVAWLAGEGHGAKGAAPEENT
jgi:hypothetical protein